jgi:hypothetical protein
LKGFNAISKNSAACKGHACLHKNVMLGVVGCNSLWAILDETKIYSLLLLKTRYREHIANQININIS